MRMKQRTFMIIFAIVCSIIAIIVYPTKEKGKVFDSSLDMLLYVYDRYDMQIPVKIGFVKADKEINVEGWSPGFEKNYAKVTIPLLVTFSIIDSNGKIVIIKYIDNGPGKKVRLLSTTNVVNM